MFILSFSVKGRIIKKLRPCLCRGEDDFAVPPCFNAFASSPALYREHPAEFHPDKGLSSDGFFCALRRPELSIAKRTPCSLGRALLRLADEVFSFNVPFHYSRHFKKAQAKPFKKR